MQEVNVDCYLTVLWLLKSAGLSVPLPNHLLDWMESEVMWVGLVSHSTNPLCQLSRPCSNWQFIVMSFELWNNTIGLSTHKVS